MCSEVADNGLYAAAGINCSRIKLTFTARTIENYELDGEGSGNKEK